MGISGWVGGREGGGGGVGVSRLGSASTTSNCRWCFTSFSTVPFSSAVLRTVAVWFPLQPMTLIVQVLRQFWSTLLRYQYSTWAVADYQLYQCQKLTNGCEVFAERYSICLICAAHNNLSKVVKMILPEKGENWSFSSYDLPIPRELHTWTKHQKQSFLDNFHKRTNHSWVSVHSLVNIFLYIHRVN